MQAVSEIEFRFQEEIEKHEQIKKIIANINSNNDNRKKKKNSFLQICGYLQEKLKEK